VKRKIRFPRGILVFVLSLAMAAVLEEEWTKEVVLEALKGAQMALFGLAVVFLFGAAVIQDESTEIGCLGFILAIVCGGAGFGLLAII
jgi:hypothetical protein